MYLKKITSGRERDTLRNQHKIDVELSNRGREEFMYKMVVSEGGVEVLHCKQTRTLDFFQARFIEKPLHRLIITHFRLVGKHIQEKGSAKPQR